MIPFTDIALTRLQVAPHSEKAEGFKVITVDQYNNIWTGGCHNYTFLNYTFIIILSRVASRFNFIPFNRTLTITIEKQHNMIRAGEQTATETENSPFEYRSEEIH